MTGPSPIQRATAGFGSAFGGLPAVCVRAPGRVNLIGEHTDYNEGFVLPCAIEAHIAVAARRNGLSQMRVVACDQAGEADQFAVSRALAPCGKRGWPDYLRGVVVEALKADWDISGLDVAVAGNIPQGAGLSSSAALEVGFAAALSAAFDLRDTGPSELARLAQRAENDFVGIKCGIMDQLSSACGSQGNALLIDCRSLEVRLVPVPVGLAILIVHSGVKHTHMGGEYNARREQCDAAAGALGVGALRDASLAGLEQLGGRLDSVSLRRARHVITENARTVDAARALEAGDLMGLGALMKASHQSMREDFEITTPEIDHLVDVLQDAIGTQGGARMTGGGFGGCVVAVLEADRVEEVTAVVRRAYFGSGKGLILSGRPAPGLQIQRN